MATVLAVAIALLLVGGVALAALQLEDAVLSYVKGESLWSKAQKEAVIALEDYARTGDPAAWKDYRNALDVPLGDRQARLALQREPPDLEKAREGFLQGGLNPSEVDGMIRLFRWFGDWGPMAESIRHWTAADSLIAEMQREARRLRAEWQSPPPDTDVINNTLAEIEALNAELDVRGRKFTTAVDHASDVARWWSQGGIAGLTVLLLVTAAGLGRKIYRMLQEREASLRRSEQRYRHLFEHNVAGVFRSTPDGTLLECNQAFAEILGYDAPDEAAGIDVEDSYAADEDRGEYLQRLQEKGRLENEELHLQRRDGSEIWVLENSALAEDPETGEVVNEGTLIDITERKEAEKQRRLLSTAVEAMRTGVLITGPELEPPGPRIQYVNPAMTDITGYTPEELIGETPRILQGPETDRSETRRLKRQLANGRPFEGETINYRKDGTPYQLRWQVTPLRNEEGGITHFVSVQEDVTEQKRTEKELEYQALHDPLTGLANRTLLSDRLKQGLARARREGEALGLLIVDIDHFKRVNDRLGHTAGDRVLTELARRLQEAVREADTVARWGGDEFAIVLPELRTPEEVDTLRERIDRVAQEPIEAAGESIHVDLSIGAVVRGEAEHPRAVQTEEPEELLRFGSLALHWAKEEAPRGFRLYDPAEDMEGSTQIRRETELRKGLERKEFVPYYQPIVRLDDGSLVNTEVLARWRHPERGLVSPAEFIPLAEELGLVGEIEEIIARRACRDVAEWQLGGSGERTLKVGLNISAQQFSNRDLAQNLKGVVEEAGCRPEQITLEVTETSVMRVPARIEELRDLGFRVSIDDFGTGYSTFTYLRDLKVDELKIDLSFVQGITDSGSDAALVETMVVLGKRLGLDVVAEGIATEGQRAMLHDLGCTYGQGFLFARPMPGEELYAQWLHKAS